MGRQAGDLGPDVQEGGRYVPEEDWRRNIGQEPLRSAKDEVHPARLAGIFTKTSLIYPGGGFLKQLFGIHIGNSLNMKINLSNGLTPSGFYEQAHVNPLVVS